VWPFWHATPSRRVRVLPIICNCLAYINVHANSSFPPSVHPFWHAMRAGWYHHLSLTCSQQSQRTPATAPPPLHAPQNMPCTTCDALARIHTFMRQPPCAATANGNSRGSAVTASHPPRIQQQPDITPSVLVIRRRSSSRSNSSPFRFRKQNSVVMSDKYSQMQCAGCHGAFNVDLLSRRQRLCAGCKSTLPTKDCSYCQVNLVSFP
jgi:hypothetical protein